MLWQPVLSELDYSTTTHTCTCIVTVTWASILTCHFTNVHASMSPTYLQKWVAVSAHHNSAAGSSAFARFIFSQYGRCDTFMCSGPSIKCWEHPNLWNVALRTCEFINLHMLLTQHLFFTWYSLEHVKHSAIVPSEYDPLLYLASVLVVNEKSVYHQKYLALASK